MTTDNDLRDNGAPPRSFWQGVLKEARFLNSRAWRRGQSALIESRFLSYMAWSRGAYVVLWGLVCGTVAIFAMAGQSDPARTQRDLRTLSAQFEAAERWEDQQFVLLRLLDLEPNNAELRYMSARNLERQGETTRAARIMAALAPEKTPGHPRAHLARAMQLRDAGPPKTPDDITTLKFHLEQAARDAEIRPQARQELARLALRTGDFSAAIDHLKGIPNLNAESHAAMAAAYRRLGQPKQAAVASETSLRLALERLQTDTKDVDARLLASSQYSALQRESEALALLELGCKQTPDPRYGPRIAQSCLRLAGLLAGPANAESDPEKRPPFDVGRALDYLQRALRYAPQDPLALEALAKLALVQSPAADEARNLLRDILARGAAPPIVHIVLGTAAMLADKPDEATLHLEQAFRLDPAMTVTANNLAYVLAHATPPQSVRALELIDKAIAADPRQPEFRDTRGEILLLLARPQDALVDLELALRAFPDREPLHRRLAQAYEQLGDRAQMARHQVRADELRAAAK